MKISHLLYSNDSADEAMSQLQEKTSKHQFMLSGKPREVESAAAKQHHTLTPVALPKMGYIQITVTEVGALDVAYCKV